MALRTGRLNGMTPRKLSFPRGEFLARQNGSLRGVLFLVAGLVRSSIVAENGKEVLIALSGRTETIGDVEYFLGTDIICDVRALEATTCYLFSYTELDSLIRTEPEIAKGLGRILASRLQKNSARIATSHAFPLAYGVLKALIGRFDGGAPAGPMSKSELAGYVGGSARHVARVIRNLEESGIVESGGGKIIRVDRARAIARMDELGE